MVDAAIVMIENAHKHLEQYKHQYGHMPKADEHWKVIAISATEVGPALFYSLLIITLSFMPIFTLEAQEGRLFAPLAYTKTYAMAAAAALAITLVPVLMGYFIRGKIPDENANPLNRILIALYAPLLKLVLKLPRFTIMMSLLAALTLVIPIGGIKGMLEPLKWPFQIMQAFNGEEPSAAIESIDGWQKEVGKSWRKTFKETPWLARFSDGLGSEFMPELDEGDLMYMPTTMPGISIGKARELLQQTDRLIKTTPEVKRVFGKIGRADTATDPAPLTMIETLIQFHPKDQWRPGMTLEKIIDEMNEKLDFPGLTNAWVMPIKTRIDMLATGIKTPVGIKVAGPDLKVIESIGKQIERVVMTVPGTTSAYSERVAGGRYIEILPDRLAAARFGLNISDISKMVAVAVGGITITTTVEGLERYPVNLRFPREARDDIQKLRELPLLTDSGEQVPLGQVATVVITDGPPMLKSENARLNGWTFVDIRGVDLGSYVKQARAVVQEAVELPAGYSITWSGQYEYMIRAKEKLIQVVPVTLLIIFVLLYLTFRHAGEAVLVMLSLPFALIGGFWLIFLLGYNLSVAVAVGLIALTGVAAEFGVIMLVYLDKSLRNMEQQGTMSVAKLEEAIMEGAALRVRPKAMTVAVIVAGLIPIMLGEGTGSEVMKRIAAPMVGGMITAPLLSLFVLPAVYLVWKRRGIEN